MFFFSIKDEKPVVLKVRELNLILAIREPIVFTVRELRYISIHLPRRLILVSRKPVEERFRIARVVEVNLIGPFCNKKFSHFLAGKEFLTETTVETSVHSGRTYC